MAEETAKETKEPAAAPAQTQPDEAKLAAAITAGLAKAMPEAIRPLVERLSEQSRPAPIQTQTITRPSEEEVADALLAGNREELVRLQRLQREYDKQERQQALSQLASQGGAAISSSARRLAQDLPQFKRFEKEIDGEIQQFLAANPGAIPTYDHYKLAHDIVRSRHFDELVAETTEEKLRKAREPDPVLEPSNLRGGGEQAPKTPTSLQEMLNGDWKREFSPKQRGVGGRTDDEELRKMGFKGGLSDFVKTREEMAALEDSVGSSFGLDRDWVCNAHQRESCAACRKTNAEGTWVS